MDSDQRLPAAAHDRSSERSASGAAWMIRKTEQSEQFEKPAISVAFPLCLRFCWFLLVSVQFSENRKIRKNRFFPDVWQLIGFVVFSENPLRFRLWLLEKLFVLFWGSGHVDKIKTNNNIIFCVPTIRYSVFVASWMGVGFLFFQGRRERSWKRLFCGPRKTFGVVLGPWGQFFTGFRFCSRSKRVQEGTRNMSWKKQLVTYLGSKGRFKFKGDYTFPNGQWNIFACFCL